MSLKYFGLHIFDHRQHKEHTIPTGPSTNEKKPLLPQSPKKQIRQGHLNKRVVNLHNNDNNTCYQ